MAEIYRPFRFQPIRIAIIAYEGGYEVRWTTPRILARRGDPQQSCRPFWDIIDAIKFARSLDREYPPHDGAVIDWTDYFFDEAPAR